jgi:hypothetical protein
VNQVVTQYADQALGSAGAGAWGGGADEALAVAFDSTGNLYFGNADNAVWFVIFGQNSPLMQGGRERSLMNLLDDFDGSSDRASWLDQKSRQRMAAFFHEIEAQELEESHRRKRDYQRYRETPLWRKIRRRVLKRDERVCRCCRGEATQVHHRSYAPEVMRGENDDELVSLCEGCHNHIEFDDFGKERTDQETDRLLLEGRADIDYPAPKVDLRRTFPQHPREWDRMSAIRRSLWDEEYRRLRELRLCTKANRGRRDREL